MQQLPLFEHDWNDRTILDDRPLTMSPAQFEIMQALAVGDMQRATELIDLQHDTDLDLQ